MFPARCGRPKVFHLPPHSYAMSVVVNVSRRSAVRQPMLMSPAAWGRSLCSTLLVQCHVAEAIAFLLAGC